MVVVVEEDKIVFRADAVNEKHPEKGKERKQVFQNGDTNDRINGTKKSESTNKKNGAGNVPLRKITSAPTQSGRFRVTSGYFRKKLKTQTNAEFSF